MADHWLAFPESMDHYRKVIKYLQRYVSMTLEDFTTVTISGIPLLRPEAVTCDEQLKLIMKLRIRNFDGGRDIVLLTRSDNHYLIGLQRERDPSRDGEQEPLEL
ncbi:RNA-binding KH domain-containing protein [Striga asiatica]|uniref:RNA-binding KH domain-containing protein n=1 Tax=Striga asiatica TaxID=4170 RepID=A0A5A7RFD4_STRAF|nr:RNA-binding KH domain-containing protein [Striga asiatica]